MFKIRISPEDPGYGTKIQMIPLMENTYSADENVCGELVDLSGISPLSEHELNKFKDEIILLSPEDFCRMKERNNLIAAFPWRHWSVVYSLRQFIKSADAGELVSFRIIINFPRRLSRGKKYFYNSLLPEIIDLCCYIASSELEELQINRTAKHNLCFALVRLANNIVAEIELNEVLPDSMGPVRFVRAYFKNGIFTNMPLGGDINVEGSLIATDDRIERFVHEHMNHDRGDELANLYFRMIYDIVNDLYKAETYTDFHIIRKTVQRCLLDKMPCKIKESI